MYNSHMRRSEMPHRNAGRPPSASANPSTFRRPGRRRQAFTLMELLVVITIIALLASMLLPAIQLVRAGAQKSVCASNQRQFGLAFRVYIQENEGMWPTGMWHQLLHDYLNEGGQLGNFSTTTQFKPGRCPSVPAKTSVGVELNASYSYTGHYYTSCSSGTPEYFGWQLVTGAPVIANARIVRRAEKCPLSEYWDNTNYSVGQANWGKSQLNVAAVARVHGTGSNFLLVDGAVQFAKLPNHQLFIPAGVVDNMWHPYRNIASVVLR